MADDGTVQQSGTLVINRNGSVTITLSHASAYVLLDTAEWETVLSDVGIDFPEIVSYGAKPSPLTQILITTAAVLGACAAAITIIALRRKKIASELKQ